MNAPLLWGTNPSNTKHHKIQNQGKKEMGLHPVSPLSFCTSSGSPTLERFLPFFLPTTHPIPSYNTFTFFIQHSDVKKKSSFLQPILQHSHFLPTTLRCKEEIFLHTTLRCKLLSSAAMETSNNLSFQAHNS